MKFRRLCHNFNYEEYFLSIDLRTYMSIVIDVNNISIPSK